MSFSPQYNDFGFEPEESDENQQPIQQEFQSFGFEAEPEKEKAGKLKSVMYGAIEGLLGFPALIQLGVNEWSKGIERAFGESPEIPFEKENPILAKLSEFPESEGQTARRLRAGTSGITAGAFGGIPGIVGGLVGSQAGQTIREVYGKEGKFEEFGKGEIAALTTDILSGGAAGLLTSLTKGARAAAKGGIKYAPLIFEEGESRLEKAAIKSAIQGEKKVLNEIVGDFSNQQIQGFDNRISNLSQNRYTDLTESSLAGLQRDAEHLYRSNNLQLISPLDITPEQGGTAIQQAANTVFHDSVINAERDAYQAARDAAKNLQGTVPKTIEAATSLRNKLISTEPSPEQNPLIRWLNGLLTDLETTTPEEVIPASKLVDAAGHPLTPQRTIPAKTQPTVTKANDLIDIVQKGNAAVDYENELRKQSHRLKPIMAILRQEVREVLEQDPKAANLYRNANLLHARNSETWGTNFMRSVRFTENPETIANKISKASNLRNLKQAIQNQPIQDIAERMLVDKITSTGSVKSNIKQFGDISPELSAKAKEAARNLVNVKDPLTTEGGRTQVRNAILKDAAQAVNTGKRPETILKLMETPKGYAVVKESLNASPQSREIFQSFERLFVEDIFNSVVDNSGQIDFNKATNIFKNREVRKVAEMIGGKNLVNSFDYLQTFAKNFEKNAALYSSPQTQGLFKSIIKSVPEAGIMATLLHAVHVPWPVIVGLGLGKVGHAASKPIFSQLRNIVLNNPKAMNILNSISKTDKVGELSRQLTRLLEEIRKSSNSD